CVRGGNYFDYW
nr:immunoglobulin heavy chain junction region [Mus musculus]